ncbi:ribose 5-phosphate isomerase B [Helicobacter labacensis]|uniref:ribose 5-phosphate isomerase B n=1 Tax=Helicobacter labacensis TaxID=2316079 RepID=UPI000EACD021|nr:ribose 5-phosphate isomerase B [Helicobacter labacensis]
MREIVLGCDHAGLDLAEFLQGVLQARGARLRVFKPPRGIKVDYPDIAKQVAQEIKQGVVGVVVCGSGIGMSMACNRVPHVRAALCTDAYMATMARLHNDANVLCLGQNVVGFGVAQSILEAFLQGAFEGGRHARRIAKLEGMPC